LHRFAFIEFSTPKEAAAVAKTFDRTPLDKKHTILVNKLTDIDRYGREGKIDEKYVEPKIPDFEEKEVRGYIWTWHELVH
jgi:translation initiation factor 3 subunit B